MFTFGEVRHPLPETTLLMEQIVHSQITRLLQQAASISKRRGSRFINQEDLLFIVRKNRELVSRLKNYLSWRKVRKIANRTGTANTAVPAEVDEDILDTGKSHIMIMFN